MYTGIYGLSHGCIGISFFAGVALERAFVQASVWSGTRAPQVGTSSGPQSLPPLRLNARTTGREEQRAGVLLFCQSAAKCQSIPSETPAHAAGHPRPAAYEGVAVRFS